ncbi:hypothetical protein DL767_001243 [Monosporascus sp. MG133]|nr:hypothetical protein DL767_001243 [Monosporascus sp. MG133]
MSELQVPLTPPKARQDIRKLQTEIAGYHGEPFRGAGWGNPAWLGGYCDHGNVLFPVWHRAYLLELERALQSTKGCGDVTLPYWNETDSETENTGLPKVFYKRPSRLMAKRYVTLSTPTNFKQGSMIPIPNPDHDYTKPPGYETVRYPFSGLVGPKDVDATKAHNQQYQELPEDIVNGHLNENAKAWLGFSVQTSDGNTIYTGNRENDAASFDPLFYFHHCFIDKAFWDWQLRWNQVEQLEVTDRYPGTTSVDNQGPTPGVAANTWLDMDTPLQPFEVKIDHKKHL